MAAPKKPSSGGSKSRSDSSSRARKPAAKKAAAGKKATATKSTAGSSTKTTRKKAPAKAPAKRPAANEPVKTAKAAKAEATAPSLRPGSSRRRWGRVGAVVALLVIVGVVVGLIIGGGGSDKNAQVAETTPTATNPATNAATATPPASTAPAVTPPPAPAPAAKPAQQVANCDPIIGTGHINGGKSYAVTSSAPSGQDPANCAEAHSVLLSALSSQSTSVGSWSCKTNPAGSTVAVCKSGGRTIQARG